MGSNPMNPLADRRHISSDPAWDAFAITPGSADLAKIPRTLRVGGAGDLVVVTAEGNEVILEGVNAGEYIPLACKKVLSASTDSPSTSTTATNIVGFV